MQSIDFVFQVELFNAVEMNGYKIVYLSARAIGQVSTQSLLTMHAQLFLPYTCIYV